MKRLAETKQTGINVEYLKSIFEYSPLPTVVVLPDAPVFTIVYVNSAFDTLRNSSHAHLNGKSIFKILPPDTAISETNIYPIKNEDGDVDYLVYSTSLVAHSENRIRKITRANQELKQVKDQYQQLFNSIHIPVFVFDVDTLRYLDVNNAAVENYGYSREEFLSITILDIRPAEDIPYIQDIIKNKLQMGLLNRTTSRHIKKNGELITVITEGNSIDISGRSARIVTAIDITEKLKAERILMKGETLFRSLIQECSDLIGIVNGTGKYMYVSPTYEKIFATKREHLISKNAFDYVHPDDLDQVTREFNEVAVHKRVKISPYRFAVKPGGFRWMESVVTDMRDDPNVMGILVNSRDVTEITEREIELAKSIERFDIVSKATSDAIYDYNIITDELKWNRGIYGIFGFKNLKNLNMDWWHCRVHSEDIKQVTDNYNRMIASREPRVEAEYRFKCADGSYKYVLDRSFLIYDQDHQPIRMIGALQDITEKVSYIQDIEAQNGRLKEISWMQSHVVRAPLARLMALAELISSEEMSEELLVPFRSSANELDQIIRNIVKKAENL